jgi:UDP-GlcNAc:undecaprenyl-phosphate GlcNAc-1-phosphate transferase
MIYQFLLSFLVPFAISLLITPSVIWLAPRIGAMDQPNERKIHKVPTPRLGGVAIYASFLLALGLLNLLNKEAHNLISLGTNKGVMFTIALVIITGLGIFDDLRPRTPSQKFAVQLVASTLVYLAGFQISAVTNPFGGGLLNLGIFSYPATVLWIVGITNAFNLIDGLDGLAAGVAAIACLTIFGVSLMMEDISTAMLILILAGAVIGFLRYNFSPAKIFLGDSGSLFLGFAISVLSMKSSTKGSTALAVLVPILALGLPIMDTLLSMIRRLLASLLPQQTKSTSFLNKLDSMFSPDHAHIHHRLMDRGLSHRNAVLSLYLVAVAFSLGALAITTGNHFGVSIVLVTIAAATFIGVRQLRYQEMAVLRNGLLLPMYEWPIMNRRFFRGFLDVGFMILAYAAACALTSHGETSMLFRKEFLTHTSIICGIQLGVFYFSGLQKGTFRYTGIGDILKMFRSVVLAVTLTAIVFAFFPNGRGAFGLSISIIDFYALLSLVLASRLSFNVLSYFFRRENGNSQKCVVIHGAGAGGLMVLQRILNEDRLHLAPVGFLDESPALEGTQLNGYPVFGGHWKIPKILRRHKVEEIILSSQNVSPQVLLRLRKAAREYGIKLRKLQVDIVDFPFEPEVVPAPQAPPRIVKKEKLETEGRNEVPVPK